MSIRHKRPWQELVAWGFAVFAMTGCVTPTALRPEDMTKVKQTHVRAYIPQRELKAQFVKSNLAASSAGSAGALLGCLIDTAVNSYRSSNANARVIPLLQIMPDEEVRSMYWQAISNALSTNSWLRLGRLETFTTAARVPTKPELTNDAVLVIGTSYLLSADCRVLIFSTGLSFFLPGTSAKEAAGNIVSYHSTEIGKENLAAAIPLWTTNNGAGFRHAVAVGVAESAKLVRYSLDYMGGVTNSTARPANIRACLVHADGFSKRQMSGHVLEDTSDRIIFQTERGSFFSFPRQEVGVEYLSK